MAHLIGTMLDRNYNAAHADHIHVEPPTRYGGTPPKTNPGKTEGVRAIYTALEAEFGRGAYFLDSNGRYVGNDAGIEWTHMGGYNRRYIGGTSTWSQHSWWNALDIGPYVGKNQDKFIEFLRYHVQEEGYNQMALSSNEEETVRKLDEAVREVNSNGGFAKFVIPDIRKNIVTMDELQAALAAIQSGNVDAYARDLAERNAAKIQRIKEAI